MVRLYRDQNSDGHGQHREARGLKQLRSRNVSLDLGLIERALGKSMRRVQQRGESQLTEETPPAKNNNDHDSN